MGQVHRLQPLLEPRRRAREAHEAELRLKARAAAEASERLRALAAAHEQLARPGGGLPRPESPAEEWQRWGRQVMTLRAAIAAAEDSLAACRVELEQARATYRAARAGEEALVRHREQYLAERRRARLLRAERESDCAATAPVA